MKLNRQRFAMVAGLGLLSAGCLGAADDRDAEAVDALPSDVLSTNHHTGSNGLNHDWFRTRRNSLYGVTGLELLTNDDTTLNSIINTTLCTNDVGGPETLMYALDCGLPQNKTVTCDGLIKTGANRTPILSDAGWLSGTLSSNARFDILACVAAHVNAYNIQSIPLVLTGAPINGLHELGDNTFEEATWTAEFDTTPSSVKINAWPSAALEDYCDGPNYAIETLEHRLCSWAPGECYFTARADFETACVPDPETVGTYTCDGKPAITTWLDPGGVTSLHAPCQLH